MFFSDIKTICFIVLSNITSFKTIDKRNETVEGDNITLSCTTTVGEPSPQLEIRKGRNVLNSSKVNDTEITTLLYHFEPISKDDSGIYSCRVTTDGYTSDQSLELKVKCK